MSISKDITIFETIRSVAFMENRIPSFLLRAFSLIIAFAVASSALTVSGQDRRSTGKTDSARVVSLDAILDHVDAVVRRMEEHDRDRNGTVTAQRLWLGGGAGHIAGGTTAGLLYGQTFDEAFNNSTKGLTYKYRHDGSNFYNNRGLLPSGFSYKEYYVVPYDGALPGTNAILR